MDQHTPFEPVTLTLPEAEALPLIADSPHSGTHYPKDFQFTLPFHVLRSGEDTDVNALWHNIPKVGGTLLAAEFPRSYIDTNRRVDDIDIAMFTKYWSHTARPSEKSNLGAGLIWTTAHHEGESYAVYDHLLEPTEVENRIDRYYVPYYQTLNQQVRDLYQRFGGIWHLNLHSMPTAAYERLGLPKTCELADFVLGNRDGTTSSTEFIHVIADSLKDKGYSVALNDPYKGVALVSHVGKPQQNRHSVQIEVHRKLYMHEETRERNDNFEQLQTDLDEVSRQIACYVKKQI